MEHLFGNRLKDTSGPIDFRSSGPGLVRNGLRQSVLSFGARNNEHGAENQELGSRGSDPQTPISLRNHDHRNPGRRVPF